MWKHLLLHASLFSSLEVASKYSIGPYTGTLSIKQRGSARMPFMNVSNLSSLSINPGRGSSGPTSTFVGSHCSSQGEMILKGYENKY